MNLHDESITKILSQIADCDVILTNSNQCFVGLYYDENTMQAPVVMCRYSGIITFWIRKLAEMNNVLCIEDKPLAYALYEDTKESLEISKKYWSAVALIYRRLLDIYKKENSDDGITFSERLDYDVYNQLVRTEYKYYKRAEKSFAKKMLAAQESEKKYDDEELINVIKVLVDLYKLNLQESKCWDINAKGFYLEAKLDDYNAEVWQMLIISYSEEKIYIGSRNIFRDFDFSEIQKAIVFLQELVKEGNKCLKTTAIKYCEEFDINPKVYEVSVISIKTLLEINYNDTGIEYGCDTSDTTVFMVYLKEPETNKMYKICMTYKEFIRNPESLKTLIASPKKQNQWNFWCRINKYNQKYFEEKFQTIER